MGRLVEFDLKDGGTILVEVHETTRTSGPVTRDFRGDQVTERARHTFEDAVERVEPAAQAIITRLRSMAQAPTRCRSSSAWTCTPKPAPSSPLPVQPPTSKSP